MWCGMEDPVAPPKENMDLMKLLTTWHEILGDNPVTAADLMSNPSPRLQARLPKGNSTKAVGKALAKLVNQKSGRHMLSKAGRSGYGTLWKVTKQDK